LPIHFSFGVEDAGGRIDGAVARDIGAHALTLNGLVLDTRFLPAGWAGPRAQALVIHVVEGAISIDGRTFDAGSTFVFPSERIPPETPRSATIRSTASRLCIVSARVPAAHAPWLSTEALELSKKGEAAWRSLFALLTTDGHVAGTEVFAAMTSALSVLVDEGLSTHDDLMGARAGDQNATDAALSLGAGLFSVLSRLRDRPTLIDLRTVTGLSERHLLRTVLRLQEEFGLVGSGWRDALHRWRLTAAVLLLSSKQLSLDEVTALSGYGSATALATALRGANLPAPGILRKAILDGDPARR